MNVYTFCQKCQNEEPVFKIWDFVTSKFVFTGNRFSTTQCQYAYKTVRAFTFTEQYIRIDVDSTEATYYKP